MAAPPLRTELSDTSPNPTNAVMRTGMGKFWDYVTGLLGSTGNAAEARAALGAFASAGGNLSGAVNESLATLASAATINPWVVAGNKISYTGTVACTAIAAAPQAGASRRLILAAAAPFTASANMLIDGVTSGNTITLAAEDEVDIVAKTTTQFRLLIKKYDGTAVVAPQQTPSQRQTILSGPVDSNGFAAFGGTTGSTTVTASGTLVVTAAQGLNNRIGSITNPQWTGVTANSWATLTINADGTCTPNRRTLQPIYQWGGTPNTSSGQLTFNTQEMTMYLGNGTTASPVYEVVVGEFTASGTVSAIAWHQIMSRYDSGWTNTLPTGAISRNHLIGLHPEKVGLIIECLTADAGYAVGDRIMVGQSGVNASYAIATQPWASRTAFGFTPVSGGGSAWTAPNKSTGATSNLVVANWRYKVVCERGWS